MPAAPPDADVVARTLAGDRESFAILVQRYENEFAAYATYMTGSADEAADIIQDSLLRAYRALQQCRDPANFKGWLFRIVSNECRTYLTRRRRRPTASLDQTQDPPAADRTEARAEAADLRRQVHEAMQDLPLDQREALVLRYVEGFSVRETARLTRASVSAVKMRLHRGRAVLRERFRGVGL